MVWPARHTDGDEIGAVVEGVGAPMVVDPQCVGHRPVIRRQARGPIHSGGNICHNNLMLSGNNSRDNYFGLRWEKTIGMPVSQSADGG